MNLREFLTSPVAYLAPANTIDGLAAVDAERRHAGVEHSIAQIVAHLAFWQAWFYARCTGEAQPMVSSASAGWPPVQPASWPELREGFLEGVGALAKLADGDVTLPIAPAIEFPPLANYTISDALVHVGTHNAHHLGQVIVLRQLQGSWPPPAGSYTW
jgi:uncharacterized damage-inducible protein DinB